MLLYIRVVLISIIKVVALLVIRQSLVRHSYNLSLGVVLKFLLEFIELSVNVYSCVY